MSFQQPAMLSGLTGLAAEIARGITETIREADAGSDRSQQKAIGVSEVGVPCDRQLVYRMFGHPVRPSPSDPWKANVGTSIHEYLRWIYSKRNEKLTDDRERYALERKVQVAVGLAGTCDVLDRKLRLVVDYKSKGDAKACAKAAKNPDVEHVIQTHCYGQGWINAGEEVEHVALVYLPRNGDLDGIAVWTEPYDPQVAADAVARRDRLLELGLALNVEDNPQLYAAIPTEPSVLRCTYCKWHNRDAATPADGCVGYVKEADAA